MRTVVQCPMCHLYHRIDLDTSFKGKFLKTKRTNFYLLIKYTNYFGFSFNTQTNLCCLLNTKKFEIHRFYTSF